ncbi:MAG TPA: hypothetical protein VGV60_16260 [Candidatus Polarisedimenticolia bacterium]|jgi:hypothetical protein|nr:hypothetical protein [Candidatus Polarisedimenticolia bacterium]
MTDVQGRTPRLFALILGALSLALFFVPLIAPLLQAGTLVYVLRAAWRGTLDLRSVLIGTVGAALGFLLFLALEFVWIV